MDNYRVNNLLFQADQARSAIGRLRRDTESAPPGNPAELYHLLGTLRLLIDDLAQIVPVLHQALEEGLLDGRVVAALDRPPVEDVWTTVGAASRTLAEAEQAAKAMSRDLGSAQLELRDLAAP